MLVTRGVLPRSAYSTMVDRVHKPSSTCCPYSTCNQTQYLVTCDHLYQLENRWRNSKKTGFVKRPWKTDTWELRHLLSLASFFQVTLWSPKWRSLNPWKGHFRPPKGSLRVYLICHPSNFPKFFERREVPNSRASSKCLAPRTWGVTVFFLKANRWRYCWWTKSCTTWDG